MNTIFDSLDDSVSKVNFASAGITLINGDAFEELKKVKCDMVATDPPYNLEFGKLYPSLAPLVANCLPEHGHAIILTGHYNLFTCYNAFIPYLNWNWTLSWRYANHMHPFAPGRDIITMYKPVLWFMKGLAHHNVIGDMHDSKGRDKEYHEWGQATGWFAHYIKAICPPNGVVCDPFMGGGTTAIDCIDTKMAFIGIEQNKSTFDSAVKRIATYLETGE